MTYPERKGWWLYETQGFPLTQFIMKTNDTWCCFRCGKPLIPMEGDQQNEVIKIGCAQCRWTITKTNELEFF